MNAAAANPASAGASGANLARGLALVSAAAACLFGPAVFADAGHYRGALFAVMGLAVGAALMAAQGRLPAPRSVGAALLWVLGSVLILGLGLVGLGFGTVVLMAGDGAAMVAAATAAWLLALLLNAWAAARALRAERRLMQCQHLLYGLSALLLLPLASLRVAELAYGLAEPALLGGPLERLLPGLALGAGLLFLLGTGVAAWRAPAWLAALQLRGRLSISAVGETLWFAALALVLLPVAMSAPVDWAPAQWLDSEAWRPEAGSAWGDMALRIIAVVLVHGIVRLALGRAGSVPPVSLLVLCPGGGAAVEHFMARLPGRWRAGPVTFVSPPGMLVQRAGAHYFLARLLGQARGLLPDSPRALAAWTLALPGPGLWRALPVQEAYVPPERWAAAIAAWTTPQTWLLLLDDGTPAPLLAPQAAGLAQALPAGRTLVVALGAAAWQEPPAALRHVPLWRGESAASLARWLQERVRPPPPRRLLLLHAREHAAVADRLVAALQGRHDNEGRFVEAAAVGQGERVLDWRMPLGSFRAVQREVVRYVRARARQALAGGSSLGTLLLNVNHLLVCWLMDVLLSLNARGTPEPYDLVVLDSPELHAALARSGGSEQNPLIAGARRSISVMLTGGDEAVAGLNLRVEGRIDALGLNAAAPQAELAHIADTLLAQTWVRLSDVPRSVSSSLQLGRVTLVSAAVPSGRPDLRVVALSAALQQRLGTRVQVEARAVDAADLPALLRRPGPGTLLLLTEATLAADVKKLQAVIDTARGQGLRVLRVPLLRALLLPTLRDVDPLPMLVQHRGDEAYGELNASDAARWVDAAAAALLDLLSQPLPVLPPTRAAIVLPDWRLLSGRADGQLVVAGGTPWPAHEGGVQALLALGGTRFVSGGGDGRVCLWERVAAGSPLELGRFEQPVRALARLSAEGVDWLVAADEAGVLRWWSLDEPPPRSGDSVVSRSGDSVVSRSGDSMVSRSGSLRLPAQALALDGDEDRLFAACGAQGLLTLFPLRGPDQTLPQTRASERTADLVCVGGHLLIVAGAEGPERGHLSSNPLRRDPASTSTASAALAWPAAVTALAWVPGGACLFGDAQGGVHRWWPERPGTRPERLATLRGAVRVLAALPDGSSWAATDGALQRISIHSGDTTVTGITRNVK